ncbi:hypothetical protein H0H93_011177 [Arthromyces matolae]|nr:hypothetical protein H0H93_011177 [Arthromyces matolae]
MLPSDDNKPNPEMYENNDDKASRNAKVDSLDSSTIQELQKDLHAFLVRHIGALGDLKTKCYTDATVRAGRGSALASDHGGEGHTANDHTRTLTNGPIHDLPYFHHYLHLCEQLQFFATTIFLVAIAQLGLGKRRRVLERVLEGINDLQESDVVGKRRERVKREGSGEVLINFFYNEKSDYVGHVFD